MAEIKNPLAELAELLPMPADEIEANNKDALFYQLRFGETEIPDPDHNVTVGLKRAWLMLDLAGLAVRLGSAYGTIAKPNTVVTKITSEQTTETGVSASAEASLSLQSFLSKLTFGATGKKHSTSRSSTATETQHNRVTARSANRWEFSEPDGVSLSGDYILPDVDVAIVKRARIAAAKANGNFSSKCAVIRQHISWEDIRQRLRAI